MDSIITGDFHVGLPNNSFIRKDGRESNSFEIENQLNGIVLYCVKNKIKSVKILGDVFDNKRPKPEHYLIIISFLNKLEANQIEADLFDGNHETSNSGKGALHPLKKIKYKYIHIHTTIESRMINGINWIFCPHITKSKLDIKFGDNSDKIMQSYLTKEIEKRLVGNKNIICGHFQYRGAVAGAEEILLEGGINFFPELDKKRILKIFLAHIHKRQLLKYGKIDLIYPGSLMRCDFSERDEDKGFVVYNDSKNSWFFEDIRTTQYRQINIDLLKKNNVKFDEAKLKKLNGSIIKIVINCSEENKKKINIGEIESIFSQYAYIGKIERVIVSTKEEEKKDKKISLNPEKLLKRYIIKNVEEELKQKMAMEMGIEIMNEARGDL